MLGEALGEEHGKVTVYRVLPPEGGAAPKVEVSFQATGTILGVAETDIGTYLSVVRPDGTLFGEGHGILTGQEGESATWIGNGVGRMTGKGSAVTWRGAVYYQTASPKWARLNGIAAVFEYETDETGNTTSKLWEWK
jgi:hypothetical protein